ncbi:hypothetical protein NVP1034O_05 [Vibrio phage 1.034.O._10N.261.46.B7]|nr:hypothetical protein NVP1034O_05 [Vibrio phage 1.034.O._10N.261.46.B7]AUR83435.1 hypothetical protein NVP1034X_05 [Vibrio phage 1.034.X._10N.261.46.B7]
MADRKFLVGDDVSKEPGQSLGGSGGGGTGDMEKSVYDTNDNGIVDNAEKVEGIDAATNNQFYGKDADGNIGFHTVETSGGEGASVDDALTLIWQGI